MPGEEWRGKGMSGVEEAVKILDGKKIVNIQHKPFREMYINCTKYDTSAITLLLEDAEGNRFDFEMECCLQWQFREAKEGKEEEKE